MNILIAIFHSMVHNQEDRSKLKIILTNDDGIEAPGLEVLFEIFKVVSTPIIVAPEQPQSGISHSVTTRSPISINRLEKNRFSVGGTPADCARIAVKEIAPDAAWLISGINPGANLGSDVYQSVRWQPHGKPRSWVVGPLPFLNTSQKTVRSTGRSPKIMPNRYYISY